tara:strand:+ start:206 stop:424 length:219 start_codon:yes stop_codon:yes gene_type:complete
MDGAHELNMPKYIHIARVKEWMNQLGIERGFEQDTIRRKRRLGKFNVPCIKVGNTPYFKETDLLIYLERRTQ